MNKPPSIIYMGTPDFAVPPLDSLDRSPYDLRLVVTQPDRPKGRGRGISSPPVKRLALNMGYEILQPRDIRDPAILSQLKAMAPDFLVVVAFGQILPQPLLDIPRYGAINVHGSLLPRYRGPAPIQWAIMRGEIKTGVTTILMDRGVDTGDMLLKSETPITPEDTAETLHDRLAVMGADLLIETIGGVMDGSVFPLAQDHKEATYAPMLTKENGRIHWNQSVREIDAHIRAMTPWPGAYCHLQDNRLKIHKATPILKPHDSAPGTVLPGFPDELRIATGDYILSVLEIQGASGKRMPVKSFLNGHPIHPGDVIH